MKTQTKVIIMFIVAFIGMMSLVLPIFADAPSTEAWAWKASGAIIGGCLGIFIWALISLYRDLNRCDDNTEGNGR